MLVFTGFLGACLLLYGFFITYLSAGFKRLRFGQKPDRSTLPPFSLIVPYCNDSAGIASLLPSLESNLESVASPYQLLFVNDHSLSAERQKVQKLLEASTLAVAHLDNEGQPGKKQALRTAYKHVQNDLIVQTDADCILKPSFFQAILRPFSKPVVTVSLGLVKMIPKPHFWPQFAALDFLSLQASGLSLAAMGWPIMGNGAAIAYRKELTGLNLPGAHWPSGDDVFLIQHQASLDAKRVATAPDAQVTTAAPESFKILLNQRIRWGAKTTDYPSLVARLVAIFVAFINALLVLTFLTPLIWGLQSLWLALSGLLLKAFADYLFLSAFAQASEQPKQMHGYGFKAMLHPFFTSFTVLMILGSGKKVSWKGRSAAPVKP